MMLRSLSMIILDYYDIGVSVVTDKLFGDKMFNMTN
jgi:hypothetical protein